MFKRLTLVFFERLCMLTTCLLILCSIAVMRDGTLAGRPILTRTQTNTVDTAAVSTLADGTIVVNSTGIAKDVMGYGGPVPMKLFVSKGYIDSIVVLKNAETPEFFERVEADVISLYKGKGVADALKMNVDAVSGATLSSNAVKTTIHRMLARVSAAATGSDASHDGNVKSIAALVVALMAALLPIKIKNKAYRLFQHALNVLVLGFWTGTFISYPSLLGALSHGVVLWQSSALIVLFVVAVAYPFLGRSGYYCTRCCPLGSLQALAGQASRRRFRISQSWFNRLYRFRVFLWCILMLLAWAGIAAEWMNYELFTAFLWQSASWVVLLFFAVIILLSFVFSRPYCRFICPTGTLLKFL